jgi:uncharacterized integral membrane protein
MDIKNGYYQKTIYGPRWVSYEKENQKNWGIVIVGLLGIIIALIFNL